MQLCQRSGTTSGRVEKLLLRAMSAAVQRGPIAIRREVTANLSACSGEVNFGRYISPRARLPAH